MSVVQSGCRSSAVHLVVSAVSWLWNCPLSLSKGADRETGVTVNDHRMLWLLPF